MLRAVLLDHSASVPSAPFDLSEPPDGFYESPFHWYRLLHDRAPIARARDGSLMLSRWADVVQVYRDASTFSSDKRVEFAPKFGVGPLFRHHTTSLVFNDDPYHGRVRRRLATALTPRAVNVIADRLADYCRDLVDCIAERGWCEAIADYAGAVPVRVIGDMLDVPEADRALLRDWSLAILGALEPLIDEQARRRGDQAVQAFTNYVETLIGQRRARPQASPEDLLSRLMRDGENGEEPLAPDELVHNMIFLLNAGHETTTNLIGSALHLLAFRPDLAEALRADPDSVPEFVEEVLRCESPNQLGNRRVVRSCTIGDVNVAEGTLLTLMIGAANRDPSVFPEPDRFDITRRPNRHLAFGAGVHQCAGLSLARIEAQVAIRAWLNGFDAFTLDGAVARRERVRFRGLAMLPIATRRRSLRA